MRALLLGLMVAGLVAVPTASAAAFDLPQGKLVERALEPGTDAVFEVPVVARQAGVLYAKLLVTDGNAVNDGKRVNGSVANATGWRVAYAMVRSDGERVPLGAFTDSTSTAPVAVAADEALTLEATVSVPDDAARGGPSQRVYVALAYRPAAVTSAGSASGATMDESRALTLLLSNALLPPAPAEDAGLPAEVAAPTEAIDADDADAIPQVGPIMAGEATVTRVVVTPFPTWFLAGALALLATMAAILALGLAVLILIWRDLRGAPAAPEPTRRVPVTARPAAKGAAEEPDAQRAAQNETGAG